MWPGAECWRVTGKKPYNLPSIFLLLNPLHENIFFSQNCWQLTQSAAFHGNRGIRILATFSSVPRPPKYRTRALLVGGFNPFEKVLVNLYHESPKIGVKITKHLKPPPSLVFFWDIIFWGSIKTNLLNGTTALGGPGTDCPQKLRLMHWGRSGAAASHTIVHHSRHQWLPDLLTVCRSNSTFAIFWVSSWSCKNVKNDLTLPEN